MQSPFFLIFFILLVLFGTISTADAHTAKVVGDFKIDIGWEKEPPLVGIANSVVFTVTLADESDKLLNDMIFFNKINDSDDKPNNTHLSDLTNSTEAYIKIDNSKTRLVLEESQEKLGVYTAKYTPDKIGVPSINFAGVIKNLEFELTSKIETIEKNPDMNKIPDWIKNNAKWWADDQIDDGSFVQGIQHLIKEKIITIPNTTSDNLETSGNDVPNWIKNNAKWWADDQIGEDDFLKGIEYLVKSGIIKVN